MSFSRGASARYGVAPPRRWSGASRSVVPGAWHVDDIASKAPMDVRPPRDVLFGARHLHDILFGAGHLHDAGTTTPPAGTADGGRSRTGIYRALADADGALERHFEAGVVDHRDGEHVLALLDPV